MDGKKVLKGLQIASTIVGAIASVGGAFVGNKLAKMEQAEEIAKAVAEAKK